MEETSKSENPQGVESVALNNTENKPSGDGVRVEQESILNPVEPIVESELKPTPEEVKQNKNISVTLYEHKGNHIVKRCDFGARKVIFKRPFDNGNAANNYYEDIILSDIDDKGNGLRGRYQYMTNQLNAA